MRLIRWIAAAVLGVIVIAAWGTGVVAVSREKGYFSPIFAPDGQSVFAIGRDVRATIVGFGHEFFTPPASVRLHRDRFTLLNFRLSDGRMTVVEEFPPSPLEGSSIQAYYGSIFGEPHAHLRWSDADHLDYELGVTKHQVPSARTFVVRRIWNPATRAYTTTAPWQETWTSMAGDEPAQLHGDLEVIAVAGEEMMPCAIAVLRRDAPLARAIIETRTCRARYPSGLSAAALAPLSRRAAIEHSELIKNTYAALVERGRASGRSEGQAILDANEEMSRRGLFPKSTKLVAHQVACADAATRFQISTEQFSVGLFSDIAAAIAAPDQEVDKSIGAYIVHRDYATSQQINAYIDAGHSTFFVEASGGCWRLTITR